MTCDVTTRLDVGVYCAFSGCGHECLKSEMPGHTARCEFKFKAGREASVGVPIPRAGAAEAAPSSAIQGPQHPLTRFL